MNGVGRGRTRIGRRGFSLLEALLAIALLLALSASVYTFLFELFDRRTRVLIESDSMGALSVVFDRIEHDLAGAVAAVHDGGGLAAGVSGSGRSLRVISRAVVGVGPIEGGVGTNPGDLRTSELSFDASAGHLLGRSWATLLGDDGGEPRVLLRGVRDARFRYHDGSAWRESFDSLSAGELPMLVEVSVWAGGPRLDGDDADGSGEGGVSPSVAESDRGARDEGALFDGGPRSAALDTGALLEEPDLGRPTRRRVFAVPDAGPGAVLVESGGGP